MLRYARKAEVLNLRGSRVTARDFEVSVQGQFLAEARAAVALSRKGRVHLVESVCEETLRALHQEAAGGEWIGKFPMVARCKDGESLCGPMVRGMRKVGDAWLMGDGETVRFFEEMPGAEAGTLVEPIKISLSERGQANLQAFAEALEMARQDK